MAKKASGSPDHGDRYEHAAEDVRNMRHPDGVVQQKVQLTPPGEPTHVPQRKHDVEGYRTVRALGGDVPAFNPDAPPVTLREDEMDIGAFGTSTGEGGEFAESTEPPGLTRMTEPAAADQPPEKAEGGVVSQSGKRSGGK